jgi:hypothetical protein
MKIKFVFFSIFPAGLLSFFIFATTLSNAQSLDTLRVMAYNVLGFGSPNTLYNCQAPVQADMPPLYADLKAIVQYANPDIIGLDKMQCISASVNDFNGISSFYFPDSVLANSLNAAFPNRYSWCPFTDLSLCHEGFSNLLFYDQKKLVYLSTTPLTWEQEDIDLYKFYYNEWFGGAITDTTYLYVILCHTLDASVTDTGEDEADSAVMNKVRTLFTHTPNLIYMGDFNTHESTNPGYEYITQTTDTNYVMNDPPFHPDAHLTYPQIWHSGNSDQAYFTTTTREDTLPNACGTTGGAKDWYDHILLSPWIVDGTDNIVYVRNSYKTIGNDGARAGISVNTGTNTSAPSNVINALYNFSDKYPVEVTLSVNPVLTVKNIQSQPGSIKINNPVEESLVMHFASFLISQNITMSVYDVCGRNLYQSAFNVNSSTINKNISFVPGVYFIHFNCGGYDTTVKVVKE